MKWKRNTGFDQIEDRRGQGGGGLGGMLGGGGGGIPIPLPGGRAGGGIGGIIVVVLFLLFSGVLNGGSGSGGGGLGGLGGGAAQPGGTLDPQGDTDQQLGYIVNSIQTYWASSFQAAGKDYPETKLVLFDNPTQSGCGQASPATGPFYCPADQKIYLELGFFDQLKTQLGAKGGDFAMAYVVAHEFGHHVQNALGIAQSMQDQVAADPSRKNDLSVRLELQADCLAGRLGEFGRQRHPAGRYRRGPERRRGRRRRPDPGVDDRASEPRVVDPRFRRATDEVVHHRLPGRGLERLRHVRPVGPRRLLYSRSTLTAMEEAR
ncbi:MAG: neutral zinc metallopeptidase [Candidatus Limnocylindrales bacterium]